MAIKLVTKPETMQTEAVDILESALEQAKKHGFVSVAISGIYPDGDAYSGWYVGRHGLTLLGGLDVLKEDVRGDMQKTDVRDDSEL